MAEVVLRRLGDGSWVWRYRAPEAPEIVANRVFRTKEGAVASARLAYPGVPVRSERRLGLMRRPWLIAAVAAAAAAVAVRPRRRRVRARAVSPARRR